MRRLRPRIGWWPAASASMWPGITWFARREADESSRLQLTLATVVMALGVAMLAWFPSWSDRVQPLIKLDPQRWYLLTGAMGLLIVWRCVWAVIEPIPARCANGRGPGCIVDHHARRGGLLRDSRHALGRHDPPVARARHVSWAAGLRRRRRNVFRLQHQRPGASRPVRRGRPCWPRSAIRGSRLRSTTQRLAAARAVHPPTHRASCGACWRNAGCVPSSRRAPGICSIRG